MKNPNRTRDELVLALDLYIREGRHNLGSSHPGVVRLSELLKQLPIHHSSLRDENFRNQTGVSMKLGNFAGVDPEHPGVGLERGNKLEVDIWEEFANDQSRLQEVAASIYSSISEVGDNSPEPPDVDEEEFSEGRILTQRHKRKERNKTAVDRKKRKVFNETGKLGCEACHFDIAKVYGSRGESFEIAES